MTKNFLGRGWTFPVTINERGGLSLSEYEKKIRESIFIIVDTAKGERVMRPDFGCDIHDLVFSVINASTLTLIKYAVKEALVLWEPRIEVIDVEASSESIDEGILSVRIDYKIRTTNAEFNLVYPFYLETGGR